ncbi:MAG: hypothetical protein WBB31_19290 [Saprospiraceae bacterium]
MRIIKNILFSQGENVSTRSGGYGGSDIWMVRQISPGIMSNPINAGPGINAANNEGRSVHSF